MLTGAAGHSGSRSYGGSLLAGHGRGKCGLGYSVVGDVGIGNHALQDHVHGILFKGTTNSISRRISDTHSNEGFRRLMSKDGITYFCYLQTHPNSTNLQEPWPELKEVLQKFTDVTEPP